MKQTSIDDVHRAPALVALALVALVLPLPALATAEPSDHCGACHRDIYRMWRDSAHAQALEDPFFLEPLNRITARYGLERTRPCIGCHAPLALLDDDLDLSEALSHEGVNCEFCHGVVAVDMVDGTPRHRVEIGTVKRATIPHADSPGHDVAYSELHASSLVCAPCHEYVADGGLPIMSTYSEWRSSSAAERGETCQTCHMNLVRSNVVDPRIKRDAGAEVNLHEMPGGHSLQQLHKALRVRLAPRRTDDGLRIAIELINQGAGHAVPTGMPGRRIILSVDVQTSGGASYHDERLYEKRFVDAGGRRVDNVADHFFADGLSLAADTRLGPDEQRSEAFDFEVPRDETAWVTVKLEYEHAPWGPGQERVSLTFYSESRFVRRES